MNQAVPRLRMFETVMSSPDKIALLEKAQQLGYRTYLYYIATDDPAINVARYARSLDLLLAAVNLKTRVKRSPNRSKHYKYRA